VKKNFEKLVISKIVLENDFAPLLQANIDGSYFFIAEERAVFEVIYHFFQQRGEIPSEEYVHKFFPSYEFHATRESWDVLLSDLLDNKFNDMFSGLHRKIMDTDRDSPLAERIELVQQGTALLSDLRLRKSNIINMREQYGNIVHDYEQEVNWGLALPWSSIYETTMGLVDGELHIVYGRPGSMKTFLMCCMAAFLMAAGYSWVFFTREMRSTFIRRRIIAILASVDYTRFLRKRLTMAEEDEFKKVAMRLESYENCYIVDRVDSGDHVSGMRAVLQSFDNIDVVFNDGIYLMRDEFTGDPAIDWKSLGNVIWGHKKLGIEYSIPIVATSQENREAEKKKIAEGSLAGLSFSDLVGMTADSAMRSKLNRKERHLEIDFPKLREGSADKKFYIHAYPCQNMEEKVNHYAKYTA